ncbi:BTB/POZ domain-containing protein At1g30440 isoform X1 [Cryptomeria japonica]|uniref:BTB/POZ domain-containing protein At1g30440 isoform X1 n=2 Tax=Cryptomeria japonica TaxID=3369 RepID=UPI0025AD5887|nr:BTB/POZ domain-containing protein At1g30440 isoform X1 [Cryptomeria japonica]
MDCEKLGSKPDGFERRGQAWFCTTGLPSDIVIEVEEMSFHLHKFPLMSRSGKLTRLITELNEEEICCLSLSDVPGGPEAFELAAKFCYGMKLEITPLNVGALHCIADYLEMTEEFGEGNLLTKSEGFLIQVVLRSWKDSVLTLQSCERFIPQAERLQIVKKCVDSIAMKACTDPGLVGWPRQEHEGLQSPGGSILWNGISTGARHVQPQPDWWYEDIAALSLPLYKLVISAMEDKDIRAEIIAGAVVHYSKKSIPGLTKRQAGSAIGGLSLGSASYEATQREILETVESLLPVQKNVVSSKFLFGLLRTAIILNASEPCRSNLERRIGMQLEHVTLDDLLIPSYSYNVETLYDIECVQRIVQHCIFFDQQAPESVHQGFEEGAFIGSPSLTPLTKVGKLVDAFLAEVAPDVNLKPDKFQSLAEALPNYARLYDDGLYRAIDVFLKAHPWLTESERERLCTSLDCQKLTLEACTHAAQNERLPLRVVVQVLFFEQLQLRNAIAGSYIAADTADPARTSRFNPPSDFGILGPAMLGGEGWNGVLRENQVLRMDMNTIKSKVTNLERECFTIRQAIHKIEKPKIAVSSKARNIISKFGCKFRTQVCDSQERTVITVQNLDGGSVETPRRSRHRRSTSVS